MHTKSTFLSSLQHWYETHEKSIYADFFKFLRFKTVSARHQSLSEIHQCADFLKSHLEAVDFKVAVIETEFAPCIIATRVVNPHAKTVLLYHHYDVQPEDPLNLWDHPPFEPVIHDGAVYARGAQDNKGQCFYTLTALRALKELGLQPDVNIKILIEGEEEIGSPHLKSVLEKHQKDLKADYLFVVDSGIKSIHEPVIAIGARGILTYDLKVTSQDTDLHSGEHGGMAFSATRALVELLAKCFDQDGKVAVDGFYDGVDSKKLDPKIFDLDFDEKAYQKTFGIKAFSNLPGTALLESNWIYPTLEINGIYGGYAGEGFKTVLPKEAVAKLSIRTVPHQDAKELTKKFEKFLQKHVTPGIHVNLHIHGLGDYSHTVADSKIVHIAKEAYSDVFDKPCKLCLVGGSIPITTTLMNAAQAEMVLIGTGLMDDNIHAPNERFRLEAFRKGFLTIARILDIV